MTFYFVWFVLGTIVMIAFGVCFWAVKDTRSEPERPKLWSPLRLAMIEHELGIHKLSRKCAEDGCHQCRMAVSPRPVLPI